MINITNEFFKTSDFSQQAILMNVSGSGITKPIIIIFNDAGFQGEVNNVLYATEQPEAVCMTADVEDTKIGSLLKIDNVWYNVTDVSGDGTGVSTLKLSKDRIHGR